MSDRSDEANDIANEMFLAGIGQLQCRFVRLMAEALDTAESRVEELEGERDTLQYVIRLADYWLANEGGFSRDPKNAQDVLCNALHAIDETEVSQ